MWSLRLRVPISMLAYSHLCALCFVVVYLINFLDLTQLASLSLRSSGAFLHSIFSSKLVIIFIDTVPILFLFLIFHIMRRFSVKRKLMRSRSDTYTNFVKMVFLKLWLVLSTVSFEDQWKLIGPNKETILSVGREIKDVLKDWSTIENQPSERSQLCSKIILSFCLSNEYQQMKFRWEFLFVCGCSIISNFGRALFSRN